ncbi:MAG: hypothetical protein ABJD97_08420 [Betaproteobacteria bacterium]
MFQHHRPHPHVHVFRLRGSRAVRRVTWGTALIVIGIAHLLKGQGLITPHELWLIAPALVALHGVARLVVERDARAVVNGVVCFAVAAYLFVVIEQVGGWTLATTWPVLLIAVGVVHVAHALFDRRAVQEPNW